jgi:hypothetical protein
MPGPYPLGELTIAGTTGTGAFGLAGDGAVAVTQPYALEDFAPSPSFTVGGTSAGSPVPASFSKWFRRIDHPADDPRQRTLQVRVPQALRW